jgi:hypothetical protein
MLMKTRYSPNRLAKLKSVKSTYGEVPRLWELRYISTRSAKWLNYLAGNLAVFITMENDASRQTVTHVPKEAHGNTGCGGE